MTVNATKGLEPRLEDQVYQALRDLNKDLRREYDIASCAYPDMVKKESAIPVFLLATNNNPEKAAERLANYWKARKYIFGERWLLPMNQTGTGALSMDDVEALRSGFMVILPRPNGGYLSLRDESRCPHMPQIVAVRILFYWYTNWSEMGRSDNNVLVHVITSGKRPPMNLGTNGWKAFFQALPVNRVPKVFVVQAYEYGKKELIDYYGFQQVRNAQFKSQLKVEHIVGDSVQSTLDQLDKFGIERQLMPRNLGGTYDYFRFDNWIRSRLTVEGSLSLHPIRINFVSYGARPPNQCKDVVAVKQAQERYQEDVARLKDTCRVMKKYKNHLKKQNQELQNALAQAKKLVSAYHEGNIRQAYAF